MITLTEDAQAAVLEAMAGEEMADPLLRIAVLPGGCSGLQYGLNVEPEAEEDDEILEIGRIRVCIDPFSIQYLDGTVVDWIKTTMGAGFTFQNPNAGAGCGCGSSFTV